MTDEELKELKELKELRKIAEDADDTLRKIADDPVSAVNATPSDYDVCRKTSEAYNRKLERFRENRFYRLLARVEALESKT